MNIDVELKHVTPLHILVDAIRECWESQDLSDSKFMYRNKINIETGLADDTEKVFILGPKDKKLIETVIEKNHTSTLEHIFFNFRIMGISRLNLQELARHRIASLSVKSTRYTLKELKEESPFFCPGGGLDAERGRKYVNLCGDIDVDACSLAALENLRKLIQSGIPNDVAKYALPESYRLNMHWSINARSLQNFLGLRLSKAAHFEIRELAKKVYDAIPEDYQFLFTIKD